ncbi:hypothetical protein [Candidatus Accumulibacter sp. ACC012]|uniref:hypothetical protein n=1 Tax=Candidatus Accumulibacter sp. ACC012 TaxID=2823332 RepID=UPI0025BA19BC|nr:hypothetical protein [Candidatus Accumulibacter sp. ACC012]
MPDLPIQPVESLQHFKGVAFPSDVRFRQILVTGPPGAGKSTMIRRLGGWSEEGYLDISRKYWWRSELLSIRPREIHLGLPMLGLADAVVGLRCCVSRLRSLADGRPGAHRTAAPATLLPLRRLVSTLYF